MNENTLKAKLRNDYGQSAVELALLTPLLLVALYIPADFGIAFLTAHLAQNAVREGARIGSALSSGNPSAPIASDQANTIKNEVFGRLPHRLSQPTVNVKFYFAGSAGTCMQTVEITATGTYMFGWYHFLTLLGFDPDESVTISRTTAMRYDHQRSDNNSAICSTVAYDHTYSS